MRLFKNPGTEALVQYALFTILIVMTPFIVVTRYLQGMFHLFSHLGFTLFGIRVPYVLLLAAIGIAAVLIWQAKNLTRRKIWALAIVLGLIFLSHQTMDIYLGMSFFDLQQNWHYFAYGAYVFFAFRAFNARRMPLARMMTVTFFSAILISLFDETFQYFLSDRVFDLSDTAKDTLGVYCGLIIILFITETYGSIELKKGGFTQRRLRDYLRSPQSALFLTGAFAVSSILVSPLLTAHENWDASVISTLGLFLLIMLILHLSQFKLIKRVMIIMGLAAVLGLSISYGVNHKKNITRYAFGLTVYKGIPLPFFDVLIYPNGYFHLVDKKHHFRPRDKEFFLKHKVDILLVGSGFRGRGGKGFEQPLGTHFIFNRFTGKGTQIIILPTPQAVKEYNRLKAAGKSVMFVLHSAC